MNRFSKILFLGAFALGQIGAVGAGPAKAQKLRVDRTTIRSGAHPWYEVKVDPANSHNLIVCGTKLDPIVDAPIGFVYSSIDEGKTWNTALEDRSSLWVTEQSCAFGPNHRAYFISEASKVSTGTPNHERGTTRLYVSTDSGQNWAETIKTGWADYSTSAVSLASRKLYTFFNSIAGDPGRTWGSNVGLLVFSSDGKSVEGPFFDRELQDVGYDGSFPSSAVALKDGSVAALYYGTKANPMGTDVDLGIVHVQPSESPALKHTAILHKTLEQSCLRLDDTSLAYDRRTNRLFVVYVDGCKNRQITLISSDDQGKTWKGGVVAASYREADNPTLIVAADGTLGLLWQDGEGSGRWLFSCIQDQTLLQPATELSAGRGAQASDDSLETWIYQSNERHGSGPSESAITVNVVNMLNVVWRSTAAAATEDGVDAVWASGDRSGTRLYSGQLRWNRLGASARPSHVSDESDVTADAVILYGGEEHFDPGSGKLDICLKLGNRGSHDIRAPIMLEAKEVESPIGAIAILNATNGRSGVGAVWDISDALTGKQIPPLAFSNSFCLSFRLAFQTNDVNSSRTSDLLVLKLRIVASKNKM